MSQHFGETRRGGELVEDPETAVAQYHDATELAGRLALSDTNRAAQAAFARDADHAANAILYGHSGPMDLTPEEVAAMDRGIAQYRKIVAARKEQ